MRDIEACIWLCSGDRVELERWIGDGNTAQKLATRARIVLGSGRGLGTNAIMCEARASKPTVWRWQAAYLEGGVQRLTKGKSKSPGKKPLTDTVRLAVVEKTAKERPADATQWSVRSMAKVAGISHTSVQRIWKAHGLKPHLSKTFKLSNDPKFVDKVEDIVGLYLDPPEANVYRERQALTQRDRAVGRREEPDPGSRSHPAGTATEKRPCPDTTVSACRSR